MEPIVFHYRARELTSGDIDHIQSRIVQYATKGSAKKGNEYQFHGQSKAVYLYPLDKHFKRKLASDQG